MNPGRSGASPDAAGVSQGNAERGADAADPLLEICDLSVTFAGRGGTPPVEAVKARVRQALAYLDPRRLLLAPDRGLMTISRQLARQKLAIMVEAARQLRAEI